MGNEYPRWDIIEFLNSEERVCLYLQAAALDDTGRGDTIRLAWRDVQEAYDAGRISINMAINSEELSQILRNHGVSDAVIRKITSALLMNLQVMTLPMAA